jgi:uncharacterized membrane protein
MSKSAAFGVMHIGIAFSVSYALTGSVTVAGAITFVEPLVNTVAHYFFDKAWDSGRFRFGRLTGKGQRERGARPPQGGRAPQAP